MNKKQLAKRLKRKRELEAGRPRRCGRGITLYAFTAWSADEAIGLTRAVERRAGVCLVLAYARNLMQVVSSINLCQGPPCPLDHRRGAADVLATARLDLELGELAPADVIESPGWLRVTGIDLLGRRGVAGSPAGAPS